MSIGNKLKIKLKQQSSQDVNLIYIRTEHLNKIQKAKLQDLVNDFNKLFADPEEKLTFTTTVKGEIRTTTDRPVYSKSYPYPMCLKEQVEKQIKEYLRDGIIRQSRSPYNAPVWVVPKKLDASGEKKYRMVVDYRKLNLVTVPDKYPIPEINDVLSQLGKNKYFSTIDLKSGFHQIPLKDSDVEKTAFSINNGKYEFTRLPFGLKNAPSIFQRALDDILRDHIGKRCYVYIDDIIIFSKDLETHFNDIKIIFETLEKANLKIQLDKSEFLKTEVEFLGFIISEKGLKTNPKKTEAIMNFPEPRTLKDLRSFLGLSGYYRRFIKDYAKLAKPLTVLLRGEDGRVPKNISKKTLISLDEKAIDAFNNIKLSLTANEVMLIYPDYSKEFQLTTDASDYAVGAVLSQNDKPIAFISRTLSKSEEHYATNEKEMLAIIWALNNLRNFLYGSTKIKIFTDHQPLTYALSTKNNNNKMKRWKAILEEYDYELQYKPGKANVVADALSRPPQINTLTATIHSDESSNHNLIPITEAPINAFKNQIFLNIDVISSYRFNIIFPTYHRHTITEIDYAQEKLIEILKRYLNPSVVNGLSTDEPTLGKIQEIYPLHFSNYKIRFTRRFLTDLTDEAQQENEILNEHKRAHRSSRENKQQLLRSYYFPKMQAKIDSIVKQCKICKTQKYERHPPKPIIQPTPIPQYPGQIVHLDIYFTNDRVILTAIDKFSKYAQVKLVKSRATQHIKEPLRRLLMCFGIPEKIVIDNEKSLGSASITHLLEDQLNIEIFKCPPYTSTVNGQIERFHSTLSEIMRCLKAERVHSSFSDLLDKSIWKYNYSIHSTTNQKPVELFFGRRVMSDPLQIEAEKQKNIQRLKDKQDNDLNYHNKKRKPYKNYNVGDLIFVKTNKRIGNKLSCRYTEEIVAENKNSTVTTNSGRIVHKGLIRN